MKWRRGDLGRFESEAKDRPRFEVVSASKETQEVLVWYAGRTKTLSIPLKTFQRDCVNWWETEEVPPLPEWVVPGARVRFGESARFKQTVLTRLDRGPPRNVVVENLSNKIVQIRSIRADYASCLKDNETLVLVPLSIITKAGYHLRTIYDRVLEEDDFGDPYGSEDKEIVDILNDLTRST